MKIIAGLSSMKNLRPNTSEAWPSAGLATNDASDETVVIIASLLAVRPTSLPSSSRKSEAWATATNRLWRVMANVAMTAIRTSCLVWCCCADSACATLVGDAGIGADSGRSARGSRSLSSASKSFVKKKLTVCQIGC